MLGVEGGEGGMGSCLELFKIEASNWDMITHWLPPHSPPSPRGAEGKLRLMTIYCRLLSQLPPDPPTKAEIKLGHGKFCSRAAY